MVVLVVERDVESIIGFTATFSQADISDSTACEFR